MRSEAELAETTVQRHLTTLETATYATARTRSLTFVTTTTGFTEARTDTTTQRLPALLEPSAGDTEYLNASLYPSTLTMKETALTIPRTVWSILAPHGA